VRAARAGMGAAGLHLYRALEGGVADAELAEGVVAPAAHAHGVAHHGAGVDHLEREAQHLAEPHHLHGRGVVRVLARDAVAELAVVVGPPAQRTAERLADAVVLAAGGDAHRAHGAQHRPRRPSRTA